MSKHIIPWRRKQKIKNLAGDLTTAMAFAVVGSPEKFTKKFHAFKVFQLLKELGAEVYPIAQDLDKLGRYKVYASLQELPKVPDVIIPCLPAEFSLSIVVEAMAAGVNKIWFQEKTLSEEAGRFCLDNNLQITQGCTLMYREFDSILKIFHPCFWHHKTYNKKQI